MNKNNYLAKGINIENAIPSKAIHPGEELYEELKSRGISQKKFSELNTLDLFKIYELRALVFVVEQNCPYQDVDELDLSAEHVLLYEGHTLAAYARILRAEKESYPSKKPHKGI